MRVYTVQHINVLKNIQKNGFYKTNKKYVCSDHFIDAYNWINNQAKIRIKDWNCERPVWLWLKKPDLRSYRFIRKEECSKEQNYVLLTLEIPIEDLLISEFNLWHFVLSQNYLAYNTTEDEEMDKALNPYKNCNYISEYPEFIQNQIKKSWERCICDSSGKLHGFHPQDIEPCRYQAITDSIHIKQVVHVKHFKMINKL